MEKHYLIHKDRKNIKFSDIKQLIIGADAKKFYKISYKNKFNLLEYAYVKDEYLHKVYSAINE